MKITVNRQTLIGCLPDIANHLYMGLEETLSFPAWLPENKRSLFPAILRNEKDPNFNDAITFFSLTAIASPEDKCSVVWLEVIEALKTQSALVSIEETTILKCLSFIAYSLAMSGTEISVPRFLSDMKPGWERINLILSLVEEKDISVIKAFSRVASKIPENPSSKIWRSLIDAIPLNRYLPSGSV